MVHEIADMHLERMLESGSEVDFVAQYSQQVPIGVICEIMGVPRDMREQMHEWALKFTTVPLKDGSENAEQIMQEKGQAMYGMIKYFSEKIDEKIENPGDDIISEVVKDDPDGYEPEKADLVGGMVLLLTAGNITTVKLISNALWEFTRQDLIDDLANQQIDLEPAIEEVLRYRGSVHTVPRSTVTSTELYDQEIPEESRLEVWIAAANRDPRKFDNPDTFIPERDPNDHIGFGTGRHYCLGAVLARLEARVALRKFFQAVDDVELAIPERKLEPHPSAVEYGVKELPIRISS